MTKSIHKDTQQQRLNLFIQDMWKKHSKQDDNQISPF